MFFFIPKLLHVDSTDDSYQVGLRFNDVSVATMAARGRCDRHGSMATSLGRAVATYHVRPTSRQNRGTVYGPSGSVPKTIPRRNRKKTKGGKRRKRKGLRRRVVAFHHHQRCATRENVRRRVPRCLLVFSFSSGRIRSVVHRT